MALVNPNIAMSFRQPDIQVPNALAQYAQLQQIQTGQLQNQLAQQQFEQEQGAINYLRGANLATPEGRAGLRQFGKTGLGYEKLLADQEMAGLKRQEIEGKLRDQRMTALGTGLTSVLKDPSDASLTEAFDRLDATGVDTRPFRASLLSEPDLAKRQASIQAYVTSNPEGRQALTFVQPKPEQVKRADGSIIFLDQNPNSVTFGKEVLPAQATGMTPAQIAQNKIAQDQLNVSKGQLGLSEAKFAWEKANPGFELKEAEDGSMVGVNKRTLQAFPITIGGAAPAAAPTMPGAGMPGPRVPAPATAPTQVIPGMTSVLDQRAPAAAAPNMAPAAGTQLRGKGNLPAKFADTDMQLSGLAGSLKEFKDEVGKKLATGAKFLPAGADTARMQAKYTSLLMGVKDLYTLGALAGPDMSIIESQLTNPASWSGKMTSQKGFEEQVKVIEDMLKRTAVNLENTYGRQPRATKQSLESLGTGLPGASANNPLGLPGL